MNGGEKVANRKRKFVLRVPVTPEERALIQQKMAQLGTKNFSAYARKMLIDGYIVHIDTGPVRAQTAELQKIGVNINQIARRINSTGTVYAQDLEDMFISFRAPGQERFTRCKTLGEDYTEERITQRIKGIAIDRGPRRRSAGEISLRIAMEDSIKAQQSAGYARWAKLHNLKQAANSLNFITEHQIDSYEGLESRLAEISAANDAAASALKDAERRLGDMALLIKNLSAYKQLRPVALELRNAKDKAAFRRQHESQLILYEAAAKALKEAGITKLPNLYALKTEYKKLDAERERLSAQYSEAKQKLKEYGIVKQSVDSILRTAPGKEHTQER